MEAPEESLELKCSLIKFSVGRRSIVNRLSKKERERERAAFVKRFSTHHLLIIYIGYCIGTWSKEATC